VFVVSSLFLICSLFKSHLCGTSQYSPGSSVVILIHLSVVYIRRVSYHSGSLYSVFWL
jgi:hypothetical protein